jgi:hypothetical protein
MKRASASEVRGVVRTEEDTVVPVEASHLFSGGRPAAAVRRAIAPREQPTRVRPEPKERSRRDHDDFLAHHPRSTTDEVAWT